MKAKSSAFGILMLTVILLAKIPNAGRAAEPAFSWKTLEAEAVSLLSRYIQIDTTNPPGNEIKAAAFLKEKKLAISTFSWQEGYGVFSYSKSQAQKVVSYVLNQPVHHKKESFKNEYFKFLTKFGIEYDERYLFEFYN